MKKFSTLLIIAATSLASLAQPAINAYRYNRPQQAGTTSTATNQAPLYQAPANGPQLFGNVISSKVTANVGMNSFTTAGEFTLIANQAKNNLYATPYAGIKVGNFYYSFRLQTIFGFQAKYMGKYDIERGWTRITSSSPSDWTNFAIMLAQDPTTATIYGITYTADGKGYTFVTYDIEQCKSTVISSLDDDWAAFSFDAMGQGYAIDWKGNLNKVDKATGNMTPVGSTGVTPYYAGGGIIDTTTGLFYWTVSMEDGTGALYTVNLTDGKATLLTKFANNEEVCGMYLIPSETSSIEDITGNHQTVITAGTGEITIEGANGMLANVVTFDGHVATTFTCNTDKTTVNIARGLYIVKVGQTVAKVAVH